MNGPQKIIKNKNTHLQQMQILLIQWREYFKVSSFQTAFWFMCFGDLTINENNL
jgi:hypothetical protein